MSFGFRKRGIKTSQIVNHTFRFCSLIPTHDQPERSPSARVSRSNPNSLHFAHADVIVAPVI